MVAGSYWLCVKLQSHHFGGWVHTITPLYCALLVNHSVFSLVEAYAAVISEGSLFLHLPGIIGSTDSDNHVKTPSGVSSHLHPFLSLCAL